jgi:hypothetical protein
MATNILVSDVVYGALRLISAIGEGITPSSQMINDAVYTLNEILDSWNIDGDMVWQEQIKTFPILSQKQSYSIGPIQYDINNNPIVIPDFVASRPVQITYAAFQPASTTPTINLPLKIVSAREYAMIRAQTIASQVPSVLYIDQAYPVANIYLWTEPNGGGNLVLTYWNPLPSTLALNDSITTNFPPAYRRLLRYELAMNIAPEFGKVIPPDLAGIAAGLKQLIASKNMDPAPWAQYQVPGSGGAYDAITDTIWR